MMTTLNESTVRIEVLGEELRRLREAAGMTLNQVVDRIGISQGHLSKIEMGRRPGKIEDVASLLTLYRVRGEERLELLALAKKSGQPGLWQRQGTFEDRLATLKVLESRATALASFEALVVPGILQTMPYAQALCQEVNLLSPPEMAKKRSIGRIHRQRALRRVNGPTVIAIVAETALRSMIGGREVMREQLRYLVEAAERSNISLRVIPTAVGGHPGLDGPFLRLQFSDRPGVSSSKGERRVSSLKIRPRLPSMTACSWSCSA
nr:helix-turn-helix transcriptional regulator [Actinophytocola xanthii]